MIETTSTLGHFELTPEPNRKPVPPRAARVLSPAPVFAITSGKGGVGKTNITANLAAALALENRRVMVIDADLGLAHLDVLLHVRPIRTLVDFFAGAAPLDEIIVANRNGILLLPGASGVPGMTSLRHDQKLALLTELDHLPHDLDFVLVDTGSGISDAVTYFAAAAQEILVVVTPEPASVTDAFALLTVLVSAHRRNRFWILANNVSGEAEALRLFDSLSRTTLGVLNAALDFVGWIPRDPRLAQAVARSRMVVEDAGDAPSARAFTAVAQRLRRTATTGVRIQGNLQFFLARMLTDRRGER